MQHYRLVKNGIINKIILLSEVKMDAIERKLYRERKRKYKLLRKFRKARDIASKHLTKPYTCKFLRRQIRRNELDWIDSNLKDDLAISIYEWCKENTES